MNAPDRRARKILEEVLLWTNRSKTFVEMQWYFQQEGDKLKWLDSSTIGRTVCPHIGSGIIDTAFQQVRERLKAKDAYTGKHKYRWQAIMANAASLATYRGRSFPARKKVWGLGWLGGYAGECHKGIRAMALDQSQCLFRISLFSKDSGYANLALTWRLEVGKLSSGHKAILKDILNPEHPFAACDSSIVKKDNDWFLHLVYKDTRELAKLEFDESTAVTLQCNAATASRGFLAIRPDGSRYSFGPDKYLALECERLNSHRRAQQLRRENGHGRAKAIAKQKAFTRGKQMLLDRVRKQWISDLVKVVKGCGATSVLYREPSLGKGVRSNDWFAEHGVNWDWTKFASDMRQKLEDERIAFKVERMKLAEYRELQEA